MDDSSNMKRGAGGTSGGIGEFFLGALLLVAGLYLFLSRVIVFSNIFSIFGFDGLGVLLIPMLIGIGILFFNSKSKAGWILAAGSFAALLVGIIMNLSFFFRPTNLLVTLIMLGLIAAGAGLIARSLRPHS